jgi:hypothetical protein
MNAAREAARIRVGVIMDDMGREKGSHALVLMGSDHRNEKRIPLRESSFRPRLENAFTLSRVRSGHQRHWAGAVLGQHGTESSSR